MNYAKSHFTMSAAGADCPAGWSAIQDKENCHLATKLFGGEDYIDWRNDLGFQPSGCSISAKSKHVTFNTDAGRLNPGYERICFRQRKASKHELEKQEYMVQASEKRRQS